MKLVLQNQQVDKGKNSDLYSGEASYLSDMHSEDVDFDEAEQTIRNQLNALCEVKRLTMTVDGNSGHWGCVVHYCKAGTKLPLSIGIDEKPEAVYAFYIDYAEQYCEKLNNATDNNGKYINEEITKVLSIAEEDEGLLLEVVYNQIDKDSLMIPYPPL